MTEPNTECAICNVTFKEHGSVQHGFLHPEPPVDDALRLPISEEGFKGVFATPGATVGQVAEKEAGIEDVNPVSISQRLERLELGLASLVDTVRTFFAPKETPAENPPQVTTDEPVSEIPDTEK